ncbi:hypothetical protein [Arcticibacter sp. MXS-1]|uniref:hypothetical protein n=1 Tax=Arcticibacter sp. MXS-1 TaxID=3341726 RepID=UPI0035A8E601
MKTLLLSVLIALSLASCKKVPYYGTASIKVTSTAPNPDIYIALYQGWINPAPKDLIDPENGYYCLGVVNKSEDSQKLPLGAYTVLVVDKNNFVYSFKKFVINDGDDIKIEKQLDQTGSYRTFALDGW